MFSSDDACNQGQALMPAPTEHASSAHRCVEDPTLYDRRRRSIRLKDYDYAQAGMYFVTICVQHRLCVLCEIRDGVRELSPAGLMVEQKWLDVPCRFPVTELGPFVIMPNHIHGVIMINAPHPDETPIEEKQVSLGSVIHWFKTGTTYDYITGVKHHGWPSFDQRLWQRNYWEHIVRNEKDFERIARYIEGNPASWNEDRMHPLQPEWPQKGRPVRNRPSS